ncbi:S8 family serine peptidase [uncultured Microscilla sp.]|uniref:S8 family serine peptidase n=1 Tax=uncultured Microscilla sp. TaxID=432653 RepID=UPI00263496E8|nr:S8 family serine peptidase [uncultured Microscilla sp.]
MQHKRLLFLLITTLLAGNVSGYSQVIKKHFIYLTDKANSPYSIDKPADFLSKRSIERRNKQSIKITTRELPVNPDYITQIKNAGAKVWYSSRWLNAVLIEASDATLAEVIKLSFIKSSQVLNKGRQKRQIEKEEKRRQRAARKKQKKAANGKQRTTEDITIESEADYGNSLFQAKMIGADAMHEAGFKGKGIAIAVMDAGFQNVNSLNFFKHLFSNQQIGGTYDLVDNKEDVYSTGSHGTKVLSTMAAYLKGTIIGTAPEATYWLYRTEDVSSEYRIEEVNWLIAAEKADSAGVDIINSSLGYNTFDDASMNYTYQNMDGNTTIITQAADFAAAVGILVINSAGNEGNDPWKYIGAPADGDSVLTVGAVNPNGTYASFSSKGYTSDGRLKPNITAMGSNVTMVGPFGSTVGNGTSFSAPTLTGLAAGFWQANPALTNMQIIDYLQRSANQAAKPDSLLGYGIPNFNRAQAIATNPTALTKATDGSFSFSPNPLDGSQALRIVFKPSYRGKSVQMHLYDANGKLVAYEHLATAPIEYNWGKPGKLASGVYTLKINTKTHSKTAKVVKN